MNRILVTPNNFSEHSATLLTPGIWSLDTETTGLEIYGEDKMFALILCNGEATYYFDFKSEPVPVEDLRPIFANPESTWFIHNAKFDMSVLAREGLFLAGDVHCTVAIARLIGNDHLSYSLDQCAARIGLKKDDAVMEYLLKNKLWKWQTTPGKKARKKKLFFAQVPFEIMFNYACQDAEVGFQLGEYQLKELARIGLENPSREILNLYQNEWDLTKVLFKMEHTGVRIDREYCKRAMQHELGICYETEEAFQKLTGHPFVDSNKSLKEVFSKLGIKGGLTEKGNPSFTDEILSAIDHPVAKNILTYRESYKKGNTYYRAFLEGSDENGILHANFKQAGTASGRMSVSHPNLQNVPKEELSELKYLVRRCFIPREGHALLAIDYKQMEYRMMVDRAGELGLAREISAGKDVHQATGEMMGVGRKEAKTLNFLLLYGGGSQKLAAALGISVSEAKYLKEKYFRALPKVQEWVEQVTQAARTFKRVWNWYGRKCDFLDPNLSYKAPNYVIQGGCADVVKIAMNRIDRLLEGKKSKMIIQVHDELLFDVHESELHFLPQQIKKLMEEAYPHKILPMECTASLSYKSWADLEEMPDGQAIRDQIQGRGHAGAEGHSAHLVL